MKKLIPPYYVINWDFNRDNITMYDIMPYLVKCWKELKKTRRKNVVIPKTFEEFKEFIDKESMYMFWSRCEYEVIVTGWPQQKNDVKIDVYYLIKANIDVITKHFMDYVNS